MPGRSSPAMRRQVVPASCATARLGTMLGGCGRDVRAAVGAGARPPRPACRSPAGTASSNSTSSRGAGGLGLRGPVSSSAAPGTESGRAAHRFERLRIAFFGDAFAVELRPFPTRRARHLGDGPRLRPRADSARKRSSRTPSGTPSAHATLDRGRHGVLTGRSSELHADWYSPTAAEQSCRTPELSTFPPQARPLRTIPRARL